MRRRTLVVSLGALAAASPLAWAQQASRVYRIGLLRVGEPPPSFIEPFRQGLSDLGYVEGRNLVLDYGLAVTAEDLPEAAAALAGRQVDLIFASGAAAVLPARDAAKAIPVVFVAGIDAIGTGLSTRGLAQPGSNVTGLTTVQIDLTAKRMQMLKEMLPSIERVAFLSREGNPGNTQYIREAGRAAQSLGLVLHSIPARSASDFEEAFRTAQAVGAGALVPMDDSVFTSGRRQLVELAGRYRLPGMYPIREFVVDGGLVSLGPRYQDIYRRAATFVDKVLKGTSPADMPVEQPTTFEVVVNLNAANALGIAVPPAILARADEVIE
ncbi:MAG TPA: ABC transporter substrate-binding protein [Sphingomicrobium sp.]|nr:ABC transporter substrate-binding protein [Sphingomicrobium sp.]